MRHVDLFDRARRPAAGALLVLLAACAGPSVADSEQAPAGPDVPETPRTIRVSARADGGDPVVCAEPRPACPAASDAAACPGQAGTEDLLRRGLFQICEGFRTGELSAEEYRAGLVAYPSLVAQIATLDFLD